MPVVITDEPWVPAQETFITGPEMRGFAAGRPSRKRAREVDPNGRMWERLRLAINQPVYRAAKSGEQAGETSAR